MNLPVSQRFEEVIGMTAESQAANAPFLQVHDYYSMLVFELLHVPGAAFPLAMTETFQITDKIPAGALT